MNMNENAKQIPFESRKQVAMSLVAIKPMI